MRLDAQESARLMVDYAPLLSTDGRIIMTLKLRAGQPLRVLDHSLRLLRGAYHIFRVKHLHYNRSEITVLLRHRHP